MHEGRHHGVGVELQIFGRLLIAGAKVELVTDEW